MRAVSFIFTGTIIVLLSVIVYQAIRLRDMRAQLAVLSKPSASHAVPLRPSAARDIAAELDAALKENRTLQQMSRAQAKEPNAIAGRVEALREMLRRLPEQQIPQLAYVSDADWYAAVDGPLESAEDWRLALARIRASAEEKFAKLLQPALRAYLDANGGLFPQEVIQLQPYFSERVDPAALQHYKVVKAKEIQSVQIGGEWAITQVSVVDSEYDSHIVIEPKGSGSYGNRSLR